MTKTSVKISFKIPIILSITINRVFEFCLFLFESGTRFSPAINWLLNSAYCILAAERIWLSEISAFTDEGPRSQCVYVCHLKKLLNGVLNK